MTSPLQKYQGGLSLIYVLLLIVSLSSMMIHQANIRQIKEDRRAFEFTVAQIQNILNLANAYRLDQGHWPRASQGGACESLKDFVSQIGAVANGWGYEIVADGSCTGRNASYTISQIIPRDYYNRFTDTLSEDISRNSSGVPTGFTRMFVSIDRASVGADKVLDFRRFNTGWSLEPEFDFITCDTGSAVYLGALNSMCTYVYLGFPYFGPPPVVDGNRILFRNVYSGRNQLEYKMIVPFHTGYPIGSYSTGICPRDSNGLSGRIKAMYMAWCE